MIEIELTNGKIIHLQPFHIKDMEQRGKNTIIRCNGYMGNRVYTTKDSLSHVQRKFRNAMREWCPALR